MATPNLTEYIEIDAVPLSTPAWEILDLSPLWDIGEVLGELDTVPYRRGVVPFRRPLGGKRLDFPFVIVGDLDPDGDPTSDPREGLLANRDAFVRDVVRPPMVGTVTGTRLLRYHLPGAAGIRSGPVSLNGKMDPQPFGSGALRGNLRLVLTEGGLRSETAVEVDNIADPAPGGGFEDLIVPNPGTDYQDRATFTLSGTATSVRLTNLTADPGGDVWWEFGGAIDPDVLVDTSNYTATRAGVSVVGLVTISGFERWLPLIPGDNTIRIAPVGGTAVLELSHFPFYL